MAMAQNINNNNAPNDAIAFGTIFINTSFNALSDEEGNPKPFTSIIREIGGLSWFII